MSEVSLETKTEHLMRAIAFAKTKGVTAVKVELEATLGRFSGVSCDCDDCREADDYYEDRWDDARALGFILDKLGIHFDDPDDELEHGNHGRCYLYDQDRNPWLQYIEFYNDGSVDSEVTFTVRLDDPSAAMHVLEVIEAFKELSEHTGNGMNVEGAGMHTAWLFTDDYGYPHRSDSDHITWRLYSLRNFRRAMGYMMPALFFLAAPANGKNWTRLMHFRKPGVSLFNDKYSAIYVNGGAMEFRVFDTCYDNPEQIIDHLIVMSKCLTYMSRTHSGPSENFRSYTFGNDGDHSLERLYIEEQPMDLLYKYVGSLKPDYYTLTDLKRQRGFKLTKKSVKERSAQDKEKAELAWKEYSERWDVTQPIVEAEYKESIRDYLTRQLPSGLRGLDRAEFERQVQARVEAELASHRASKLNKRSFVTSLVNRQRREFAGQYTINVSD